MNKDEHRFECAEGATDLSGLGSCERNLAKLNARAQIRVLVRRILRKYGYSPDKQEKATQTVLEQAELQIGRAHV